MTTAVDIAPKYIATLRSLYELSKRGRPPSYRELCAHRGLSSLSVTSYHLSRLSEAGLVRSLDDLRGYWGGSARSWVVTEQGKRALGIVPVPGAE